MIGYAATGRVVGDSSRLRGGAVTRFDNHYHAEPIERGGRGATEMVVDAATGAVIEPGPAMMWNTSLRHDGRGGHDELAGLRFRG